MVVMTATVEEDMIIRALAANAVAMHAVTVHAVAYCAYDDYAGCSCTRCADAGNGLQAISRMQRLSE